MPAREVTALLPRTLMWATDASEFGAVQLRYAQRISKALSILQARLRPEAPELASKIAMRLSQATEDAIARVLLSPNVSRWLLWGGSPAVDIGEFLEGCLRVEATQQIDTANVLPMWGALGDCVQRETGEVVRWWPIDRQLPVDVESPDVIALGSTHPAEALGWTPLAPEEQRTALDALTAAFRCVRSGGTSLRALIEICAKVIVMRKQQTSNAFCSFSSCNFVGRIALVNPQLVGESLMAEALVHEAIHTYLYMQEPRSLWGLNTDIVVEPSVVNSPWTGRELPLSTFLHACFVWYGLLFFWGQAMRSSRLPRDGARQGIARASCGFTKGALFDHIGQGSMGFVRHEVQAALAQMQQNVLSVIA